MRSIWARRIGVGAIGLGFGLALGGYSGYWVGSGEQAAQQLGAMGREFILVQYAHRQYLYADYASAKEALHAYLDHLNQVQPASDAWRPGQHPLLSARLLAGERAITLGRLAVLEERHGTTEAANALWAQAEIEARTAHWRDASRTRLRELIEHTDRAGDRRPQATPDPRR